jgi:hypothetical protein
VVLRDLTPATSRTPRCGSPCTPFDDYDDYNDCSLIENCCIKACKRQRELGHPPQKTDRAVRVHVVFTLLMFALVTAYRRQCEQETTGGSPWAGSAGGVTSWSRCESW